MIFTLVMAFFAYVNILSPQVRKVFGYVWLIGALIQFALGLYWTINKYNNREFLFQKSTCKKNSLSQNVAGMKSTHHIREVALEAVLICVPEEEFSFDGVWEDYIDNPQTDFLSQIEIDNGVRFDVSKIGAPLLSATVIPLAFWVANKVTSKILDNGMDDLLERLKVSLQANRDHSSGRLSDEDIDRIASRLAKRLTESTENDSEDE